MILPRLAVRNLLGAGVRTWLNVIVLSFTFVSIILLQGFYEGMSRDASRDMIEMELGGGQYWHEAYDPYDPFTLQDAHGELPATAREWAGAGRATPILIVQGTLYVRGRATPALLKGIDPDQTVLGVPSRVLHGEAEAGATVPALIGRRMAEAAGLRGGDLATVRWRDVHGAFDALDIEVVEVMTTTVPTVDAGQVWIPLERLRSMTGLEGQATLIVLAKAAAPANGLPGWIFRDLDFLLRDIREVVRSKTVGATIMYSVLLFLALLAIFNTQVLSIFHRRKEMGTLMALGMTKAKVIQLFTLEGALHSVLAAVAAALYGLPLMVYLSRAGWTMPQSVASYGFAIGDKLFPAYSPRLIVTTIVLVWTLTATVSFLPTRRIAKLKPTDALRGRLP